MKPTEIAVDAQRILDMLRPGVKLIDPGKAVQIPKGGYVFAARAEFALGRVMLDVRGRDGMEYDLGGTAQHRTLRPSVTDIDLVMQGDALLEEVGRALRACYPDRAEAMLVAVESRITEAREMAANAKREIGEIKEMLEAEMRRLG